MFDSFSGRTILQNYTMFAYKVRPKSQYKYMFNKLKPTLKKL